MMDQRMITEDQARNFAAKWVEAWNSHNLAEIMSHYAEEVVLVSPVAAMILNDPLGTVKGKDALRAYFQKGLEAYPDLRFDLLDHDVGTFECSSVLREPEGHKDRRIYGT
jgi:ketosteroid isomerase-like protein